MNKRPASSPRESKVKSSREASPDISFIDPIDQDDTFYSQDSFSETVVETMTDKDVVVQVIRFRITQRNGEKFNGVLDRNQGVEIWTKALKFPGEWLFGIALVSGDRPFMFEYRLKIKIAEEEIPKQINYKLDGVEYSGVLVTSEGHAELGEQVKIRIKNSRWRYPLDFVQRWVSLFGKVVVPPHYIKANEVKDLDLKTDDIICEAVLRKHIPNLLPACGYRVRILYPGQPIQCGNCLMYSHVLAECKDPQLDWLVYAKVVMQECRVEPELMGKWADLIKTKMAS